ncbi:phosphatidylethanolamine-binding protein [Phytohabitans kaempferiae]|uniref:Phosphatidylethanolamine-binding protein n=1 Tax=Phytohabitans kaempferiae TaxID=1620943 RepID=A0ABV6M4U5_9ACTN
MPKPRPGSQQYSIERTRLRGMPKPRPGSHKYDVQRARLRKRLDDEGISDKRADEVANEILQKERGQRGFVRGERGLGPKGERQPGERR